MAKQKKGHPKSFTTAQNRALREALASLLKSHGSQPRLAAALGIKQQNVSRLLTDKRSGFSFSTASTVARLLGFSGVDAFFEVSGLTRAALEDVRHLPVAS